MDFVLGNYKARFLTNLNKFIWSTFSASQKGKTIYLGVSKQGNKTNQNFLWKQQILDTNDSKQK